MMGSMQCYPAKRSRRGFRRKCRTTSPHAWTDPGPTPARPLGNPDGPASGRWDTGIAEDLPPCAPPAAKRRLAGTVQRGNQNVPHERPDPPGYKVSLFCR
jgi:hypothetical protein